jgi:hypothetical protein
VANDAEISRRIDALVIEPPDEVQHRRAAINVCVAMSRAGDTAEQIRDVLAALGLLTSELPT